MKYNGGISEFIKKQTGCIVVAGAVNNPSNVEIGDNSGLLLISALNMAGGLSSSTNSSCVCILENALYSIVPHVVSRNEFCLSKKQKDDIGTVFIKSGDVVFVYPKQETLLKQQEATVLVIGAVTQVKGYSFSTVEECTFLDLLFKIGALRYDSAGQAIILRLHDDGTRVEININLRNLINSSVAENNVPLKNGDIVIILKRILASCTHFHC